MNQESGVFGHQSGAATWQFPGMTLRDYFAASALSSMDLKTDGKYSPVDVRTGQARNEADWAASAAYRYADAMIAARGES